MKIALVLSGGGARGAYEAGVLRYLREGLPRDTGRRPEDVRFDILCGTSIGAINACFMAAAAHEPETQAAKLADIWRSLKLEDVFHWSKLGYSAIPSYVFRQLRALKMRNLTWQLADFLHPEALTRVVHERIDWAQLARNVTDGHVEAVTVTTTDLDTGHSVIFVQTARPLPPWSRDPLVEVRHVALGPEHALASGAIPLLFRPVRIGNDWFSDGSVRQNTPLGPAVRLGADRLLVVGLRYRGKEPRHRRLSEVPSTAVQLGRILNSLHVDRTDYDLERLRRLNCILDRGREAFGEEFEERFNEALIQSGSQPIRRVRDLVIRPSQDIGQIARRHAAARAIHAPAGSLASRLLRRAAADARGKGDGAADFASYLLFDRGYAEELMELGWSDAERQKEALAAFFWK